MTINFLRRMIKSYDQEWHIGVKTMLVISAFLDYVELKDVEYKKERQIQRSQNRN